MNTYIFYSQNSLLVAETVQRDSGLLSISLGQPNFISKIDSIDVYDYGIFKFNVTLKQIVSIDNLAVSSIEDAYESLIDLSNSIIPIVDSSYKGSIVPSSPAPTGTDSASWSATEAGTYVNYGGLVVNPNSLATISRVDGVFSISQTPIDLSNYIGQNDLSIIGTINKFNKADNNVGGHTYLNEGINNSGVIGVHADWVGAKIPVKENTQYAFSHSDATYGPSSVGLLAYLNASGGTISTVDMTTLINANGLGGKTFTTPAGTAFIYKNVKVLTRDYLNTFQLELGSATTAYQAFVPQVNKIQDMVIIDSAAREAIVINTTNIASNTEIINEKTPNWNVSAKSNGGGLIQVGITFDTNGLVYAIGDEYLLNFTLSSTDANVSSAIKMRTFQNSNEPPTSTGGTSTAQETIGTFTIPSSKIVKTKAIAGTSRYLHIYLEITPSVTGQTTNFRFDKIQLLFKGITLVPLNYGIYTPVSGDTIIFSSTLPTDIAKISDLPSTTSFTTNYLSGKKMVNIGDSMVKGHNLSANQVWDSLIATRNNMTFVNYGINGTLLTNDNGSGLSVLNRYSTMDNDADFIGVFAGTNDAAGSITMGTDSDSYGAGQLTFKGALNDLCTGLLNKYPNKKIFFITPYNRTAGTQNYITAILTIAKKYSIPVWDNWTNGGISWTNAAQVSALTLGDTYHLNPDGMQYASTKYESFLRSL